jgi:hypothetical protein
MIDTDEPADEEKDYGEALLSYRRYVVLGDNLTYVEESDLRELCDQLRCPAGPCVAGPCVATSSRRGGGSPR